MNNKKSKKLRGINRKVKQGFDNLRKQLIDVERHNAFNTRASFLMWLSECLENEKNSGYKQSIQDPNELNKDVLIQTSNE